MRPYALAGIVLLLAGCSLPYEGTSFKALPKVETVKEGEGGEGSKTTAEAAAPIRTATESYTPDAGEAAVKNGTAIYVGDKDDAMTAPGETHPTGVVFPNTAQPGR